MSFDELGGFEVCGSITPPTSRRKFWEVQVVLTRSSPTAAHLMNHEIVSLTRTIREAVRTADGICGKRGRELVADLSELAQSKTTSGIVV